MADPTKDAAYKRLEFFVGTWKTEGLTKDGRTVKIRATDSYEWLPGKFFLLHKMDARIGEDDYKYHQIIGYDAATQTYTTRFFDSWGQTGTHQVTADGNTWTYTSDTERATVILSDDQQTLSANWEMSADGIDWQPWMETTSIRVS